MSMDSLTAEDRAAYSKITKVWTPKEKFDAHKIDLEKLADDQLAEAEARAKAKAGEAGSGVAEGAAAEEAKEVEELREMFSRRGT